MGHGVDEDFARHETVNGEEMYGVARPGSIRGVSLSHGVVYPHNRPEKWSGLPAEQPSVACPIHIRYRWQVAGVPCAARVPPNGR